MRWSKTLTVYGAHAEGEIGRVVTDGVDSVPGTTMLEKLKWLNCDGDHLRRFCLFEPRGAAQMTVNLLTPPCDPDAHAGFIPMQGDGSHAMSGSNAMCVTTVLLETGIVEMTEPETLVVLDTAAGLVRATATCANGRVERVALDFFPSFAEQLDVRLKVPELGEISVDIAFGGVYYVLVDVDQLSLSINPSDACKMVEIGNRIKTAAQNQLTVRHPEIPEFNKIEFCMLTSVEDAEQHVYRNATIMPPGRLDRSPCGTGSAARLAVMHARGQVEIGENVTMRSTIGSRFSTRILGTTKIGNKVAVVPQISGRAWIYGIHHFGVDLADPFPQGFTLPDVWGTGIEHEIPDL